MSSIATDLRSQSAAIRLSFTWFGTRKSLDRATKQEIAQSFEADVRLIGASKKLIDTRHPAWLRVSKLKGQITEAWFLSTLPFPEKGIRLIRRDRLGELVGRLDELRDHLAAAVLELDSLHYRELREQAQARLGRLFNAGDYPPSLQGLFGVMWDFPNVEPPSYLATLSPAEYERQKERVAAQFDQAVRLAEEAFQAEFAGIVGHLCDRLAPDPTTGERKVFHASSVENLREFFERFRSLNLHSNSELDALVDRAREIVGGLSPDSVRKDVTLRDSLHGELSQVAQQLEKLTGKAPRRRIDRPAAPAPEPAPPAGSIDVPIETTILAPSGAA